MKFGISTYSLSGAIHSGELDVLGVISAIAEIGGQHVEIVPIGFDLTSDQGLIEKIRTKAAETGMDVSGYCIDANFAGKDDAAIEMEIMRVKKQVDIANGLGAKFMRHDVASQKDTSIRQFQLQLPRLVEACRQIADYALQYGITTSVENHGYFIQHSDRVQMLVQEVNRSNFKTTVDIGNFMCVDEDSVSAVKKNLPLASMVHFKDFYKRSAAENPGEGWFRTANGNYLRGAITGQGDIDIRGVLRAVKDSGYDGYISLEFEGMEECKLGTKIGFNNLKRLWSEI